MGGNSGIGGIGSNGGIKVLVREQWTSNTSCQLSSINYLAVFSLNVSTTLSTGMEPSNTLIRLPLLSYMAR